MLGERSVDRDRIARARAFADRIPPKPTPQGQNDRQGSMKKTEEQQIRRPHRHYHSLATLCRGEEGLGEHHMAVLDTLSRETIDVWSLDDVLTLIFKAVREMLPCDKLSVGFVRDAGRRIATVWAKSTYTNVLLEKGFSTELGKSTLMPAMENIGAHIIGDLEAFYREHPTSETTSLLVDEGIRSNLSYPILVDDRCVGFLFFGSRTREAFDDSSVCIIHALYKRVKQTLANAWRVQQLSEANLAYVEMLGFVAHELKSPLAGIILDTKLIEDGFVGDISDEQRAKIGAISSRANYLMNLVKDYLDLARIEGGNFKMNICETVSFRNDVIAPCLDIIAPHIEQKKMQIDVELPEAPLEVQCDPELMRIAVLNLLDNAVKYGNEGGSIVVTLKKTAQNVVFSVWNEGQGFSENQSSLLFKRFSRLNTRQVLKEKGTGLGLYTAWRILALHGGTIEARSEIGLWAEFVLRFPQPCKATPVHAGW